MILTIFCTYFVCTFFRLEVASAIFKLFPSLLVGCQHLFWYHIHTKEQDLSQSVKDEFYSILFHIWSKSKNFPTFARNADLRHFVRFHVAITSSQKCLSAVNITYILSQKNCASNVSCEFFYFVTHVTQNYVEQRKAHLVVFVTLHHIWGLEGEMAFFVLLVILVILFRKVILVMLVLLLIMFTLVMFVMWSYWSCCWWCSCWSCWLCGSCWSCRLCWSSWYYIHVGYASHVGCDLVFIWPWWRTTH